MIKILTLISTISASISTSATTEYEWIRGRGMDIPWCPPSAICKILIWNSYCIKNLNLDWLLHRFWLGWMICGNPENSVIWFWQWMKGNFQSTVLFWRLLATISRLFSPWRWLNQGWKRSQSEHYRQWLWRRSSIMLTHPTSLWTREMPWMFCLLPTCWRFFQWKMLPADTLSVTLMLPTVWIF